jgi:hypothetical protein
MSVGNDSRWENIVRRAIERSYEQNYQEIPDMRNVTDPEMIEEYENFWDCFETIPNYLYLILLSAEDQFM